MKKILTDVELQQHLADATIANQGYIRSEDLAKYIMGKANIAIDPATIRGRFIAMGKPLSLSGSGKAEATELTQTGEPMFKTGDVCYVRLDVDILPDVEPHLNAAMRALGGKDFKVEYIDNKGFIHLEARPESWKDEWLTKELPKPVLKTRTIQVKKHTIPNELVAYIPQASEFDTYVERDTDKRLAMHYAIGKHPLSQGKQGTGKTLSHSYYAHKQGLPFFLFSCYEDFKLSKLFGDKTIVGGTIKFQESLFVKAIQSPSVILFDEVNAISQANTYDFHALLQNRQLFIKDANDGAGKLYVLHPDCKIGFAQNPKSAKYIGGQVRASNFLGRCTYITYPEFTNSQLEKALSQRFPELPKDEIKNFVKFYNACAKAIESSQIPFDISIRQLANVIDLYIHGMELEDAISDGLTSIAEAASQPKSKEALTVIAQATWAQLMKK